MIQEQWQAVTPQYNEYNEILSKIDTIEPKSLLDLQTRLTETVESFVAIASAKLLVINGPDNPLYRNLIAEYLKQQTNSEVLVSETLDSDDLLGRMSVDKSGKATVSEGLLKKANGGYLILSANLLLAKPFFWPKLKAIFNGNTYQPINLTPKNLPNENVEQKSDVKLVVLGDRDQLAELDYFDAELHRGMSLFTELEGELCINKNNATNFIGYLHWISAQNHQPLLDASGVKRLMVAGARYTEDQNYMPLDLIWLRSLLAEAAPFAIDSKLTEASLEQALSKRYSRASYLPERALSDILEGQVIIETRGERIGQVNGLTVIDIPGHPLPYGEPARISCVIHFGDGDISDVERKAELGGNLHAKGMMIMQAFVSSALKLDEPLPYSASVVFEQSYSEVDGDSASLAELVSFVSALSEYPINQQIAVTGAVDQFGRVQAVGGLNEKIEGFYKVCKHNGFTGQQGVILPKSNLHNLALSNEVVDSLKSGEFHIWSVETVDDAIPILLGKPFRGEDEDSVIAKIAQRIENFERHEQPDGIVERIKNWFV
ncbi:AAA family ATPase [Vibrio sonorensis]|uniref:AAA family ATPase n=1 Tax=Vibrio sonorensis TaxID=1004316 RepID=UPI0008D92E55|nr:Lon protease family protein [Vibrio sonorensis]